LPQPAPLLLLPQTLKDTFDRLIELGHLPRMPAYSSAQAVLPLPQGGQPAVGLAGATATVTAKLAAEKAAEVAAGVRTRSAARSSQA
jgi:hypothetical protein